MRRLHHFALVLFAAALLAGPANASDTSSRKSGFDVGMVLLLPADSASRDVSELWSVLGIGLERKLFWAEAAYCAPIRRASDWYSLYGFVGIKPKSKNTFAKLGVGLAYATRPSFGGGSRPQRKGPAAALALPQDRGGEALEPRRSRVGARRFVR